MPVKNYIELLKYRIKDCRDLSERIRSLMKGGFSKNLESLKDSYIKLQQALREFKENFALVVAIEYEYQDRISVYNISKNSKHRWKIIKKSGQAISIEFDILSVPEPKVYIDADGVIRIEDDRDPYTKDPMDIDEARYKGTTSNSVLFSRIKRLLA